MDQPGNHILLRGNQPGAADRMRELLARTVQDQMADQRSNAGALEEIRQRMEGLEWLVNEVRQREIPGMTAQLDRVAHHLSEGTQKAPLWAESLAEHMELLRAQVAPAAEMHPLWADIGAVLRNVERALATAASGQRHHRPGHGSPAVTGRTPGQAAAQRELSCSRAWSRRRAGSAAWTRRSASSWSGPASSTRTSRWPGGGWRRASAPSRPKSSRPRRRHPVTFLRPGRR